MPRPVPVTARAALHAVALLLPPLLATRSAAAQATLPAAAPRADSVAAVIRPVLAAMVDTAGLRRALAALAPLADTRRGARLVTIGFDTTGRPTRPRATVPALLPSSVRDTLLALVAAHLTPLGPHPVAVESHLLLETGPHARVEQTVVELRDAQVADRAGLARRLRAVVESMMDKDPSLEGTERALRLRLHLTTEGTVDSVVVLAPSGLQEVDTAAIALVRQTRFLPLLVEGEPMRTIVILPLRFVFGG